MAFANEMSYGRLLLYNKKSSGPKIDPWGTPELVIYSNNLNCSFTTYCKRRVWYNLKRATNKYYGLNLDNFVNSVACLNLSKAWEKSRYVECIVDILFKGEYTYCT